VCVCTLSSEPQATAVAKRTYDAAISVGTFTYGHLGGGARGREFFIDNLLVRIHLVDRPCADFFIDNLLVRIH